MSLSTGTRVGSYEIVGLLGEGGMGEVYRARDTKLNRDVAIKVLPEAFAADPERLARFEREAQVLAALNHPNIAAIYGIEGEKTSESRGPEVPGSTPTRALVMELVEGEDLSAQIARGALPLDDALPIARQMIDALEAAHELGIIHRDLKPQNIKVRDDGTVKVLDFGLARTLDPGPGTQDPSNSPTLTARATQMGMIIGTAAYMAPEQARGRAVDRRADIWAFGVVLYEMLTGQRAFDGEDISITLAGVLKEDVKWDALPANLPASIRRLLRRCLEKDPKRRLGAISDARLELDEATSEEIPAAAAARPSGLARWERVIWASVAGIAIVAALVFALRPTSEAETPPPMARFTIPPPSEARFGGSVPRFAMSPDGRSLAFTATSPGKTPQFWIRQLDSMAAAPLAGTESTPDAVQPQSPFWSPDSQHLAYFVEGGFGASQGSRLRTVDLAGGGVQSICELPSNNASGSWNSEGVMLVSSSGTKGIQRIPAAGGVLTQVTTVDASANEVAHLWPQFLPDGRHFIYLAQTEARSEWTFFAGSLDSADRWKVVQSAYAQFAAPNLLLYVRGENLLAQTMNLSTFVLEGEPTVVATGLLFVPSNGRHGFSVSNTGVLVFSNNTDPQGLADRRLTWVDRGGTPLGRVGPPISAFVLRLSPDGARVALLEQLPGRADRQGDRQLWVVDLDRNIRSPLATTGAAFSPAWSDDGARLLFGSAGDNGDKAIAERLSNGATPMTTLHEETGYDMVPLDASSDGTQVVFARNASGIRSLYVLSTTDGKVVPYLDDGADHPHASLSRDGRWLAYSSSESGVYEVIVQPFPDPSGGKWPISTNGGIFPRWRRDGRELFYVDSEGRLASVSVTPNQEFVPGPSQPLFFLPFYPPFTIGGAYTYDVSPDGQRFLLPVAPGSLTNVASTIPLTVITNWTSLLMKK